MTTTQHDEHTLLTKIENAEDCSLNFKVEKEDLLCDIKFLMREYYVATFTNDERGLKISLNNGQSFILQVEECK